jgi:hypothetical protein
MIGRGPSTDHVNRRFATGLVIAVSQGFAVNGDDLSVRDFLKGRDPTQESRFEFNGTNGGQDGIEFAAWRDPSLALSYA